MKKVHDMDTHPKTPGIFAGAGHVFRHITSHPAYNRLSGVLPAAFFFFLVLVETHGLLLLFQGAGTMENDAHLLASATSSIAKILFLSLIVVLFVARRQPIRKAPGLLPRIIALAGSFLIMAIVLLPKTEPGLAQSLFGLSLVAIGSGFSIIAISRLGRSFSIMAEARELVTDGVYSFVRHPLYLAEEIAILGVIVIHFSIPAVLLLFFHIALQIQRMKNEEGILGEAFPNYAPYMARTSRLLPGIY